MCSQPCVELDIVALREDDSAALKWLDEGFASTTVWRSCDETPKARRSAEPTPAASEGELVQATPSLKSAASQGDFKQVRRSEAFHVRGSRGTSKDRREQRRSKNRRRLISSVDSEGSERSFCSDGMEASLDTQSSSVSSTLTEDAFVGEEQLDTISENQDGMSSASTCSGDADGKVCKCCQKPYRGFGDSCGVCRKHRGSLVQQCRVCSQFISGFVDVCDGCSSD